MCMVVQYGDLGRAFREVDLARVLEWDLEERTQESLDLLTFRCLTGIQREMSTRQSNI